MEVCIAVFFCEFGHMITFIREENKLGYGLLRRKIRTKKDEGIPDPPAEGG
jgi:hypothetical protein